MDAASKQIRSEARRAQIIGTRTSVFRGVASAAVMGLALSACSSVPDAINPVSWYEKTTDFFAGDGQAADTGVTATTGTGAENKGLAADPNAPPPAPTPSQSISSAPSGLSAPQVAGNYASPAIERQGAPVNVLTPSTDVAAAPPVPAPQPSVAVTQAAPQVMAAPTTSSSAMPAPMGVTSAPPPMPTMPGEAPQAASAPSSMSPSSMSTAQMTPPAPFEFPPADALTAYGNEGFETVVITADGMEAMAQAEPQPLMSMQGAPSVTSPSGAQFPQPGATTAGVTEPVNVGGMLRVATIHFANNAADLDQRDRSILNAVIQLQKERGGRVVVVGHASARTKDMDFIKHQMVNFEISMNRAATIGSTLQRMGLPAELLEVQAVSDTQPLFMEVMPSGEAGNRRVELYLAGAAT